MSHKKITTATNERSGQAILHLMIKLVNILVDKLYRLTLKRGISVLWVVVIYQLTLTVIIYQYMYQLSHTEL